MHATATVNAVTTPPGHSQLAHAQIYTRRHSEDVKDLMLPNPMILLQFQDISALSNQALFYIKQYFIAASAPEELETP